MLKKVMVLALGLTEAEREYGYKVEREDTKYHLASVWSLFDREIAWKIVDSKGGRMTFMIICVEDFLK